MRGELLDARRRIRAFEAEVDSLRDENARLRERVRLAETAPAAEWDAARGTWHAVTDWAVERATALPEVWALVAEHSGLVGAWRLVRGGVVVLGGQHARLKAGENEVGERTV